jgi:hypothetical protein
MMPCEGRDFFWPHCSMDSVFDCLIGSMCDGLNMLWSSSHGILPKEKWLVHNALLKTKPSIVIK